MKVFLLLTLSSIQNHKKIIPRRIVYISLGLEFDEMPIAVLFTLFKTCICESCVNFSNTSIPRHDFLLLLQECDV